MQVRGTTNPKHELIVKKPFNWNQYEPVLTGGNYFVVQHWDTGLQPVRKGQDAWMVPKLTSWEGWIDGLREFRMVGAAGVGAWSSGEYKEAMYLIFGRGTDARTAAPPFDVPAKVPWIDIEMVNAAWTAGVQPGDDPPFLFKPAELNTQNELDVLIVRPLAVGFTQEQQVGILAAAPDPLNPPVGYRLSSGTIFVKLVYEWITVDNMTMFKLRREYTS